MIIGPRRLFELRILFGSREFRATLADVEAFCGSLLRRSDVGFLRLDMHNGTIEQAASIAMALFTHGGIGGYVEFAQARIREIAEDYPNDLNATLPLLLWQCAVDLADVDALRIISEYREHEEFREFFRKIPSISDSMPFPDCLTWTRSQRIQAFLGIVSRRGRVDRSLWLCKNYIEDAQVRSFVYEHALVGRVSALSSLMFDGGVMPWRLFEECKPIDQSDIAALENMFVENLLRGADPTELREISKRTPVVAAICANIENMRLRGIDYLTDNLGGV